MNPQIKLSMELALLAAKCGGKFEYTDNSIAIMNIQFDILWEEVYGFWP
jgi:hypothetical protein